MIPKNYILIKNIRYSYHRYYESYGNSILCSWSFKVKISFMLEHYSFHLLTI
jgi:hypothetical protein